MVLYYAALVSQKYGGHRVACSFDMVASYSLSLRWPLVFLLVQGLSAIAIFSKTSESGLTFVKKIRKKYRNTSTVDYPARTGKARQMDGRLKKNRINQHK